MTNTYEAALLAIADVYAAHAAENGGRSLARIATIVVNRGSFFERLRDGGGCSTRNLDKLTDWFRNASNWPGDEIPAAAVDALISIGRAPLANVASSEAEAA
jgi:hypothetical protein